MEGKRENSSGQHGSRWRVAAWAVVGLILLLPLVAMQFTQEVNWTVSDFVFAGVLLFGPLGTYEIAARKTGNTTYRAGVGVALAAGVLLVWVNGAVGVIGSEDNPANLIYGGVLTVGIVSVLIARFQPHGMARALFVTALAQVFAPAIALIAGMGATDPIWSWEVLLLTGFFTALWLTSAGLFRRAARKQPPVDAGL